MITLTCNTEPKTFRKGGEIFFFWKEWVTDLLLVKRITGLVDPQINCPSSLKAIKMA